MDGGKQRRLGPASPSRFLRRRAGIAGAILVALWAAACTTGSQPTPVSAVPRAPTVAFESIDGPPESIFNRLVADLSTEAETRQLAVVSRETAAHYRVRAYAATIVQQKRSVIAWVWDVYDANQQRVLRITGEEPVSGAGHTTWAAADDQVLRRMARGGMDRLVAFLAAPNRAPEPPAPESPGISVAAAAPAGPAIAYLPAEP